MAVVAIVLSSGTPSATAAAPARPVIQSTTGGTRSITVVVDLGSNGGSPINLIEYSTDNGATWTSTGQDLDGTFAIYEISDTATCDGGGAGACALADGATYILRVRTTNIDGTSSDSTSRSVTTLAASGTPAAPVIQTATAGATTIAVVAGLGSSGGSPVTDVQYSTDSGTTWRSTAQTTGTFTIYETSDTSVPLVGGDTYLVKVRAVNAVGVGAASGERSVTTTTNSTTTTVPPPGAAETPLPPFLNKVEARGGVLVIDGTTGLLRGGTISAVQYSTDGGTTWASSGQSTFAFNITAPSTNLTSTLTIGTTYQIAIRTVTNGGTSGRSNIIEVAPGAVPPTPAITSAVGGVERIDIIAALGAASTPIFAVEYSTDGGTTWANTGQATGTFTITETSGSKAELTAGTVYTIKVRSRNSVGYSSPSASKTAVASSAPMPPSLEGATASGASIAVRSTLGLTLGGSILRVEYSTDGGTTWANTGQATGTFTITSPSTSPAQSLKPGTEYTVAVRSVSTAGTSGLSNTLKVVVGRVPSPPTITNITTNGASLNVTGTMGADNGTSVLRLEYSTDNGTTWSAASGVNFGSGASASTSTSTSTSTSGGGNNASVGTTFSFNITSLSSDQSASIIPASVYTVKVRAVTIIGVGAASTARRSTAAGIPSAPVILSITSKTSGLDVKASLGNNNGAAVTEVQYSTDGGTTWISSRQTTGEFTISSESGTGMPLTVDTTYDIKIRSVNDVGTSPASNVYQERTYSRNNRITFDTKPTAKAAGGAPFAIKARTNSGGKVTFRSITPDTCDVDDGMIAVLEAGTCTLIAETPAKDPYPGASRIYQFTVTNADGSNAGGSTGDNPGTGNPADGVSIRVLAKADGKAIPAKAKITLKNLTPGVCTLKTVKGVRRVVGIADGACNIQIRINNARTIVVNANVETTDAGAVVKAGKPAA